jgi:PAS domain-containing protein
LTRSRQMLEKTFASLRDAVFIIDATTQKIIDCNPAAAGIFGYAPPWNGRQVTLKNIRASDAS